jgi:hypothetical protein
LSLAIIEVCGDSNNSIGNLLFNIVFYALLQFEKNGRRNFLGVEFSLLPLRCHCDERLAVGALLHFERPMFFVLLHAFIIVESSNESFRIENSVFDVPDRLIFCSSSNLSLIFSE